MQVDGRGGKINLYRYLSMEKTSDHTGGSRQSFTKRLILFALRTLSKWLYHQLAWTYDGVSSIVSVGNWQKWIQSVVPYLEGPRVLEIGFGPGHLQVTLHQKGLTVFGLDESRQMVRMAQKRLKAGGFHSKLVRGNAQMLPFANESFSHVVSTFPAEFIFKSSTLSEIKRVLTHRGMLTILPLAWITGQKPWERLVAWVLRTSGESPEWNPKALEALKAFGFEPGWEMIDFNNSKVLLIRLVKATSQ